MESAFTELTFSASRGLESLPDEILVEVAKHLEPYDSGKRSNLRSLSLVSKRLLASCNRACCTLSVSGIKASKVPRLLARFPDLLNLNLSFLFDCSEDAIAHAGRKCARLRELHVPDTCKAGTSIGANGKGLRAVCQGCPNLRVLHLPAYKGPESAMLALGQAQQLRVLTLKSAPNLTDAVVKHVASQCKMLEELDLSFNVITDAALAAMGANLPHLKKLDLKHCKRVSGAGIALLANGCKKLQTLHLGVLELNDEGLTALGRCSRELRELSLDYGTGASGQFSQEAVATLAMGCRKLRVLSLRGSKQVDDDSLRGLAKGCPSLEELDLHACADVSDLGLHAIVQGCKQLRVLILTGTGVGPAGTATFAGSLPRLQCLRMNGELITNDVLQSVAENCKAVEELHLSNCKITDDGLEKIVKTCGKVHALVLKSCADIKATSFAAGPLPHLHTVQLPSCGVTDQGLAALVASAPGLTTLVISSCTKLTGEGCSAAARLCVGLTSLVVTGCPQLDRDSVLSLTKAARPCLKLIRVSRPGSLDDEYALKRQAAGWCLPSWARGQLRPSYSF